VLPISDFCSGRDSDRSITHTIFRVALREPAPQYLKPSSAQASTDAACHQDANGLGGFCPIIRRK
jgi:hypothetical protein